MEGNCCGQMNGANCKTRYVEFCDLLGTPYAPVSKIMSFKLKITPALLSFTQRVEVRLSFLKSMKKLSQYVPQVFWGKGGILLDWYGLYQVLT